MPSVEEVMALAKDCAFSRRMPTKAQHLLSAAASLDGRGRSQLRAFMLDSYDLPLSARMACRACQAAPSSLKGATRIITAMESLLDKETTIAILREADYERRLMACAKRFSQPKKNRLADAIALLEHLHGLFGFDPERDQLLDAVQHKIAQQAQVSQLAFAMPCA